MAPKIPSSVYGATRSAAHTTGIIPTAEAIRRVRLSVPFNCLCFCDTQSLLPRFVDLYHELIYRIGGALLLQQIVSELTILNKKTDGKYKTTITGINNVLKGDPTNKQIQNFKAKIQNIKNNLPK